jgi:DNA-binding response OmpR family regulator
MANAMAPAEPVNQHHGPVVLVIEDDQTLSSTICYNLRREHYRPLAARDGEAGLREFQTSVDAIDLVVLDLMLPRMTGFHVLRNIRLVSPVPVLILSARSQDQDIVDGLDLGADDYMAKPFAIRELLARIRSLLRRGQSNQQRMPAVINRYPIRIDTSGHRVWVGESEIALRPKEYGLLLTLALDTGHVFTRQQLLDSVWGQDIDVDPRTVDVHVSWLRAKFRAAGVERDPIQTVHRSGYRFSVVNSTAQVPNLELLRQAGGEVQAGLTAHHAIRQSKENRL